MKKNFRKALASLIFIGLIEGCSSENEDSSKNEKATKPATSIMRPGIEYTHYPDGSCKASSTRECVDKKFINRICADGGDITVAVSVATTYSAGEAFKTLANANGVSTDVRLVGDTCYVKMVTGGVYKGTSRRLTRDCKVYTFVKSPSSGRVIVNGTDLSGCFTQGF